jgi:ferredoxin-nitrite reductase
VWQNLLLPNIRNVDLEAARQVLVVAGLTDSAATFSAGAVACTGNLGCRYAATDTKRHALALASYLDQRFALDHPLNLHVTGCPHSCAQHYIGDIGLLGVRIGGEEGYQVSVGGGTDERQGLARELVPAIPFADLPPVMEKLFRAFEEKRHAGESFLEYARRHDIEDLKQQAGVEA